MAARLWLPASRSAYASTARVRRQPGRLPLLHRRRLVQLPAAQPDPDAAGAHERLHAGELQPRRTRSRRMRSAVQLHDVRIRRSPNCRSTPGPTTWSSRRDNVYNPFGIDFGGADGVNPNATWRLQSLGTRRNKFASTADNMTIGLKGKILDSSWTWDLSGQYGHYRGDNEVIGYLFRRRSCRTRSARTSSTRTRARSRAARRMRQSRVASRSIRSTSTTRTRRTR